MFWSTFFVSLFISYIGSLAVFPILKRLKIYDIPNDRTVHEKPMLEMGGLIFIIGYFSSLLFVLFIHNPEIATPLFINSNLNLCPILNLGSVIISKAIVNNELPP